jgi:putative transposase
MSSRIRRRRQANSGRRLSLISKSSGKFHPSTVLDDFSRCIFSWKLCTTMRAEDVTAALEMAVDPAGLDKAGSIGQGCFPTTAPPPVSENLIEWPDAHDMDHVRGTRHIIREGKIERWHQTLKNRILLESYLCLATWEL